MATQRSHINLVFGIVIVLLAATAIYWMYRNRDLPPIREAQTGTLAADARLPENHPPINAESQVAALEQAGREDPNNADIKVQIGNAYYDMGQYQKAAQAYEESLKLRPENPGVETDLATCYHELGQDDKALSTLDRVLQSHPNFPQALFNKGIVLQVGKNDPKAAVAVWEALLRSNPNYPQRAELEQKINQINGTVR